MHTAVTASSAAATRWAVAMRDRAPASSAVPARRLLIAAADGALNARSDQRGESADSEDLLGRAK